MSQELLLWLAEIEIWRLQREHAPVKQEDPPESPDTITIVNYPPAMAPTEEMAV